MDPHPLAQYSFFLSNLKALVGEHRALSCMHGHDLDYPLPPHSPNVSFAHSESLDSRPLGYFYFITNTFEHALLYDSFRPCPRHIHNFSGSVCPSSTKVLKSTDNRNSYTDDVVHVHFGSRLRNGLPSLVGKMPPSTSLLSEVPPLPLDHPARGTAIITKAATDPFVMHIAAPTPETELHTFAPIQAQGRLGSSAPSDPMFLQVPSTITTMHPVIPLPKTVESSKATPKTS